MLPKNLPTPPTFRKINPADSPILNLSVQSDDYPLTVVDDYTDTILAQQISQIAGIGHVNIDGEQKPAVRVQVDPAKIASLGISLEDVRAMLATATVDAPKGISTAPPQSFTIYDNDQLLRAAPYNDLILAYRNGSPIRIRDIGVAVDGAGEHQDLGVALRPPGRAARHLQAAQRQRHRDRRRGCATRCRACRPRCRPASTSRC